MDTKMKMPELMALGSMGEKNTAVVRGILGKPLTYAEALEVIDRCNAYPKLVEALKTYGEHLYKCPCLPSNGQAEPEECTCGLTAILKETGAQHEQRS